MKAKRLLCVAAAMLVGLTSLLAKGDETIVRPTSENYERGIYAYNQNRDDEALEFLKKELAQNPKNGYAYLYISYIKKGKEQWDEAVEMANQALKFIPKKDNEFIFYALYTLGQAYEAKGATAIAIDFYEKAISTDEDNTSAFEALANIYKNKKDYAKAADVFKRRLERDPANRKSLYGLATCLENMGKSEEAFEYYDLLTKLDPNDPYAFEYRSEAYTKQRKWYNAIDDAMTAYSISYSALGDRLVDSELISDNILRLAKHDEAFGDLTNVLRLYSIGYKQNWHVLQLLGSIYEKRHMYIEAIECYSKANEVRYMGNPTTIGLINCYRSLYELDTALKLVNKTLNSLPDADILLFQKSLILFLQGKYQEAVEIQDKLAEREPHHNLLTWRSLTKIPIDKEGALKDVTKACEMEPENTSDILKRGDILKMLGRKDEAKKEYEKLLSLTSDTTYNTISAKYELGYVNKAIEEAMCLLQEDSTNEWGAYCVAALYGRMNKKAEALNYLKKALDLGFNDFDNIYKDREFSQMNNSAEFKDLVEKYRKAIVDKLPKASTELASTEPQVIELPITKEWGSKKYSGSCSLYGLPVQFSFDPNAKVASIRCDEVSFLVKNNYLNIEDIGRSSIDQQGNVRPYTHLYIKKLEIGGMVLTNIFAIAMEIQTSAIVLDPFTLGRLGKYEFDTNKMVLRITTEP